MFVEAKCVLKAYLPKSAKDKTDNPSHSRHVLLSAGLNFSSTVRAIHRNWVWAQGDLSGNDPSLGFLNWLARGLACGLALGWPVG